MQEIACIHMERLQHIRELVSDPIHYDRNAAKDEAIWFAQYGTHIQMAELIAQRNALLAVVNKIREIV